MQKYIRCIQSGIDIGATVDTRSLNNIILIDLNKLQIKVPYRDANTTILQLINTYRQMTSCLNLMKGQICFMHLQGEYKGKKASQSSKISSFHIKQQLPCFKVIDCIENQQIKVTQSSIFVMVDNEQQSMIKLQILYNTKSYPIQIDRNETVQSLKNTIISLMKEKGITYQMIRLEYNNIILMNIQKLYSYGIDNQSQIILTICDIQIFYIIVEYQQIHIQAINIPHQTSIKQFKSYFQKNYQIHSTNIMKVVSAGRQLSDHSLLSQQFKLKGSRVSIQIKDVQDERYFVHDEILVKQAGNTFKMMKNLQEGEKIVISENRNSQNIQKQSKMNPKYQQQLKQYFKITLEQKIELKVTSNTYLELQNGQVKQISMIQEIIKNKGEVFLKRIGKSKLKVLKVEKGDKKAGPAIFYGVKLDNIIISQNMVLTMRVLDVLIKWREQKTQRVTFGITSETTIKDIKQRVCNRYKINQNALYVFLHNIELANETTFDQHKISKGHLIIIYVNEIKQNKMIDIKQGIKIRLKSNQQFNILSYEQFNNKTVQQIMKHLFPRYRSSYIFLYSNIIIFPTQKLNKIQNVPQFHLNQSDFVDITIIKNQKMSFTMNMIPQSNKSQSAIGQSIVDQQVQIDEDKKYQNSQAYKQMQKYIIQCKNINLKKQWKNPQFYKPFLLFLNTQIRQQMRKYIKNFQNNRSRKAQSNRQIFQIIKILYNNMLLLPRYLPQPLSPTFFAVKNIKFSTFYNKHDSFYFYQYLITTNNEKQLRNELGKQPATLFRLISTGGKILSTLYNTKQIHLIFPPYTYFLIDKIESSEDGLDIVWISEIASPLILKKNLILWVDDMPRNNYSQVEAIMKNSDIQVLQLISTIQARKWLRQFGWLMKWKGINFKLISDGGRNEYGQQDIQPKFYFNAGFTLMDIIYNKQKVDIKAYIYCGNQKRSQKALMQSIEFKNIHQRYKNSFKITDDTQVIINFARNNIW